MIYELGLLKEAIYSTALEENWTDEKIDEVWQEALNKIFGHQKDYKREE